MSRKTYVYREGRGLVEVERMPPGPRVHLITDRAYENLTPVITKLARDKEGNVEVQTRDISSRTKHREYMKENGLALYSDFEQTWARDARERADIATGNQSDRELREALGAAAYRVFDAPGIEERPQRASAEDDSATLNPSSDKLYKGPKDTSYPAVEEFLPHGK